MRTRRGKRCRSWYTKKLLKLLQSRQWIGVRDGVTLGAFVLENLIVVSTREGLVPEEMNLVKIAFGQVPQAIRLVPTCWENIKGDLTADRVSKVEIGKLFLQCLNHGLADAVLEVKLLKLVPLI